MLAIGILGQKPTENWYGWEQDQKAYEMMSCYEGLLDLYRITGDKAYFEAVVHTWEHIRDEEINITGSGATHGTPTPLKHHTTTHYSVPCCRSDEDWQVTPLFL